TLKLAVVRDRLASPQPLSQRRLDQLVVVDRAEGLRDRAPGDLLADPGLLDLHSDAEAAAMPARRFPPRDRCRDARVVDRALVAQPRDRVVDVPFVVAFAC